MKEWINEIIQKKEVVAMPIMTHPGIEMIGKTVRDAVTDGQVHYNAIKALSEKYPTAAATVIMDLTVEAEAFGAEIVFPENEVPSVVGRLLNDEEAIDKLEIPALNKGRIPQYLKANMLAAKTITDRPVFAGCIGPYSLPCCVWLSRVPPWRAWLRTSRVTLLLPLLTKKTPCPLPASCASTRMAISPRSSS